MKADQIYRYWQNPESLNQETLPLLKKLTEQYPAFEAGWILYLRNLKNLGASSFDQELINGAIRIHNRRKLYLFLNEKTQKSDLEKEKDSTLHDLIFPTEYQLDQAEKNIKTEESLSEIASSIQDKSEKKYTLIEKFLEAQPKMPQVKIDSSGSPLESGEQPAENEEEFATETLAFIYARQGYNKKAIQIFEKLSLKYPEKSTYFAGQIEKIKNLMNN